MVQRKLFFAFIGFILTVGTYGQKSHFSYSSEVEFSKALELYNLEKYGSARLAFDNYQKKHDGTATALLSEAAYYEARCAQLLENDDAPSLFENFIVKHPESNKVNYAYFHLGEMLQDDKKYRQASKQYEKVSANNLDQKTRYAYWFKRGYCLFMEEEYDQALNWFSKVKDADTQYAQATNYYYSHIQYIKGKYDVALKGFLKLEKDPAFEKIVPFYIAQIYYLQKDYDKAIEYATPMLDLGSDNRKADMYRIVGSAWFAKKDYAKAAPYLEKAIQLSSKPLRDDYYNLGFSYYYMKNYEKAAANLSNVTSENDLMSQNAYYHLGDCYLRLNDKKRARVAFEAASKGTHDVAIQEDAMLNYLKLNYEMGYAPFNEIINSFVKFIEMFPNSTKIDQAYDYLGKAFLTTKNYKQALETMERIKKKDANVYRAMQRIAYYRGLELFTSLQFTEAIDFFTQSLKYGEYDKDLKVKAIFWRGESYYRLGDLDRASKDYNDFIASPASYRLAEFKTAHYNMGYVHFKQKNYAIAGDWFRKYLNLAGSEKSQLTADALNRVGDCFYVNREFNTAISYFDRAISMNIGTTDYAMYQKAFCLGLLKRHNEKINLLKQLASAYPQSQYVDDAYFEIGRSYVALNDYQNAIQSYKIVKEKYPKSSLAVKSLLQLGLVYYNSGDLENSMTFYKRVVNEYPGSPESEDALIGIRNIYMDKSDPNGYINYTNTLGNFAKTDVRTQDSLVFETAQRFYAKDDCVRAVPQLESYISSYPDGRYIMEAHYYKADCQYTAQNYTEAVKSYEFLANRGRNTYTEEALARCGQIFYLLKNYSSAVKYFGMLDEMAENDENRLEARIGLLRCHLMTPNNHDAIIMAANKVLWTPKLAPEIDREARFARAKSQIAKGNTEVALADFNILAKNTMSKEGAESKYILIQNLFDQGNHPTAEKEIFGFADSGTSHQYWLARSFIVLADIYTAKGENFQAEQYLKSLLENYEGSDDIHTLANQRLKAIKGGQ